MTETNISDWTDEVYRVGSEITPFDTVLDNIDRYSTELLVDVKMPPRGSTEAYDLMHILRDALMKRASETDDTVMADLSPQLTGLEGRTVQVTDLFGDTREFVVDRMSPGDLPPVHIEVSTAGLRIVAQREYERVEVVK